jgi:hypothetical protein
MTDEHKRIMDTFTEDNLPSLSVCTLGALELFAAQGLPQVTIPDYQKPIIVGSGNAIVTATLLYANTNAFFADENNFQQALSGDHDGAVIFSASGEKHAPIIAQYYQSHSLKTTLVTCNPNSSAGKILGPQNTVITPKNREPYTYNTSTYMGWIFAKTRENPKTILNFINDQVTQAIPTDIGDYDGYLLVTPETFAKGNRLFDVKFTELFARRVARDIRTYEELKHAVTVVPYDQELCIQFGSGQVDFTGTKLAIPLPPNPGPAAIMAIGYYTIGKIQESKPPWFTQNIAAYIARVSSTPFGKGLQVIVE